MVYAVMSGGFNALLSTILVEVFGPEHYASVNGFLYFLRGCGAFMGAPVGGLLLPEGHSYGMLAPTEYTKIIVFDGALLMGSAVSVALVRVRVVVGKVINISCLTAQTEAGYGEHDSRSQHFTAERSEWMQLRWPAAVMSPAFLDWDRTHTWGKY